MKSLLIIFIVALVGMTGCNNINNKETKILPGRTGMVLPNVDSLRSEARQTIPPTILYNDPVLYGGGSGIFRYFLSLLRTMRFEDALLITAKSSLHKHGKAKIHAFYKSINTDYSPVLLSSVKQDSVTTLRFKVNRYATKRYVTLNTVNEADSVRIVLPDKLEEFLR